jgi:hypothetical protein
MLIEYPEERELPDDYPIYGGYFYVADGKVIVSDWHGITAREFKNREGVEVLKNCDMGGRNLF